MTEGTCAVQVNRSGSTRWSHYEECGRAIERDGKCKMHLRHLEKARDKEAARIAKRDRGEALQNEALTLSEMLGFIVTADYSWSRNDYTGNFVVPGDWLRTHAQAVR